MCERVDVVWSALSQPFSSGERGAPGQSDKPGKSLAHYTAYPFHLSHDLPVPMIMSRTERGTPLGRADKWGVGCDVDTESVCEKAVKHFSRAPRVDLGSKAPQTQPVRDYHECVQTSQTARQGVAEEVLSVLCGAFFEIICAPSTLGSEAADRVRSSSCAASVPTRAAIVRKQAEALSVLCLVGPLPWPPRGAPLQAASS